MRRDLCAVIAYSTPQSSIVRPDLPSSTGAPFVLKKMALTSPKLERLEAFSQIESC